MSAEELSEARHVRLEAVAGGLRRPIAPDVVDQPLDGDDAPRPYGQNREQRTLLGASQRDLAAIDSDFERPEDADLDNGRRPRHTP